VSNPESPVAANNLALLLADYKFDQPSKDKALLLANQFYNSKNASFLDTLGWVHYRRDEFEKAITVLLQANQISSDQSLIYYHLGKSYFAKGDRRSAYDFLQKVEKSDINSKVRQDARRILLSMDKT
jgi:tetratricopeptide (TPR) repeat protein